jgi:hypothetical protein
MPILKVRSDASHDKTEAKDVMNGNNSSGGAIHRIQQEVLRRTVVFLMLFFCIHTKDRARGLQQLKKFYRLSKRLLIMGLKSLKKKDSLSLKL